MGESQDTEITLGTGKLLGLFLGLVVVCAAFFGLGFTFGRNSVKTSLNMTENQSATLPLQSNADVKVSPSSVAKPADQPADATQTAATETPKPDDSQAATAPAVNPPAAQQESKAAPEMARPATGGPGYIVQVAAVSKQEDADALVSALRKKSYPVFVASGSGGDKLFHVQVGPFGEMKDAEDMKAKLTGDGYNPIVKR